MTSFANGLEVRDDRAADSGARPAAALLVPPPWSQPTPPGQPELGPGGAAYAHSQVTINRLGSGASEVYLFEPAGPSPERAPVVVLGHGWAAVTPNHYGSWIAHIVRRGYTVVFPRYQADARTPVPAFTGNAVGAVRRAIEALNAPGHVRPDERGIALVGHSMGGLVVSNLAVRAAAGELPPPLALMVVTPGKTWPESSPIAFPLEDLSALPSSLLLLAVIGDDDDFVGELDARKVYKGAAAVPLSNKDYVRLFSDDHGAPSLVADHRAPAAPLRLVDDDAVDAVPAPQFARLPGRPSSRELPVTNALDYFGTWKLFDGLVDAVFRGVHREYALGGTREQRYMGHWSDRTPVRELMIEEP